ncbi:MAG: N-acyl homoserine lactonase family protein [Caldilineaceae bacterium]
MAAEQSNKPVRFGRRRLLQTTGALLGGAIIGSWVTGRIYTTQRAAPLPKLPDIVQVAPITVTTKAGIRIHALQTGFVAVKKSHRVYAGPDALALPAIMVDPQWTEWLPIYAWVIEHPAGVIVIDTGESSRSADPTYACDPGNRFVYSAFLRFAVTQADEIGNQLQQLGIPPQEVRWVIQTHLHADHMGGMAYFPNAEFLIGAADYPNSRGALPCHYPTWLAPTLVEFADKPLYTFDRSYPVTPDGAVAIVPTPGHSAAHQSVLLQDDDLLYCFAGDASFDVAQIQNDMIAGIAFDRPSARTTLARLRALTQTQPTIYLPSHDADAGRRLIARETVRPVG